jgi:hypothetical protein
MASRNPFGNLNINRDDDEDQDLVKVTAKINISASNTTSQTEMKKKKKVRPEEKIQKNEEYVETSNEGFEVVGKIKKPYTAQIAVEGEDQKKNNKEKRAKGQDNHEKKQFNKARPEKRQYERHSGTGRGKETAKNGAGGKATWGNDPEQIARQAKKEGGRDDYCKFINIFFS